MFDYVDPVGTGALAAQGALSNYRQIIDDFYGSAAGFPNTEFVRLERIPPAAPDETIKWPSFPITAPATDSQIDERRWDFQDEYVEWRVLRDGGAIQSITFSTEFPEYYEAFAEVGAAALKAAIADVIQGANPTDEELFGPGFDPATATATERANRFRNNTIVPFLSPLGTIPPNPWNNGEKGIICLMQQFNTMGALFNLARQCSVPNATIPASGQCAAVGGACGPSRNSDPRICTRSQEVCRIPRALSLADSPGIRILELGGTWRLDGSVIPDINDQANNHDIWFIDRNGRRATLDLSVGNVTVDNSPIVTGTQVSRLLDVGADVVSAEPGDLLPEPVQPFAAGAAVASEGAPERAAQTLSRSRSDG